MNERVVAFPGQVIPTEVQKPNADLVDKLRQLLAEAESGVMRGMAYACVNRSGTLTGWEGEGTVATQGWAIQRLMHQYMDAQLHNDEDDAV